MRQARISATGSYVPVKKLTNQDLEKMVDTSDEWITARTGIKERRIASKNQACSDLAVKAAENALNQRGMKPAELELIIVATVTPDTFVPSAACMLQEKLGASNAAAFDVNAACSGFIYALSVADSFVRSGQYSKVLVVGSEVLSKITNWQDRSTCILFGDGAGAVLVEPAQAREGRIVSVNIHADGSKGDLLMIPAGGSKMPASAETLEKGLHYLHMSGNETFKVAVKTLETLVLNTLKSNGLQSSQIALLIPHQANLRIIKATAERLGIPMDRVAVNIDRFGNTSAASIPIALDEAAKAGRLQRGDYVLLEAFGGGLTWASALLKW
ncbi:MAG: ketoacyl-ACP synthase III [Nitrospiraceae bacterium]|nr:ketoacyl-ACP synthase III [Nitrospiraceae bacterium]MDA8089722.1 ketoacyl-ACP synthase III [Nitrospiraceae bacterium]